MAIEYLEHINIHSENIDGLVDWYEDVLGMKNGERPNFGRGGAWLYVGEKPVLHLVERGKMDTSGEPRIEHYAMRCNGLGKTIEALRESKSRHWANYIPETDIVQVHTYDPDGNHIELAFAGDERSKDINLGAYNGD